jgi:SAM-dependent MidA family methyltransferase
MSLREIILEEIRRHRAIPFSRFMELALYHPELGYYSCEREKFGRSGDFYTASDIHAIYGRLIARQFAEMWRALGSPDEIEVVELGPGRGLFAQDLLAWADKKFPEFARALHYSLVESSPALRRNLQQRFAGELQGGRAALFGTIQEVPHSRNAIIFANEFLDAIPVEVVSSEGQLFIGAGEKTEFIETWHRLEPRVRDFIAQFGVRADAGERVEACPQLSGILQQLANQFERGFCIIVDYGYTRAELDAGRHRDTVRAFREHTLRTNVLAAPGEQDITADLNFTAVAELGKQDGMDAMPLLRQSQFLIGISEETQFADVFEGCTLPQEHTKRALQLKHLITPEGLGEAFRVLVMYKGIPRREVERLNGLKFVR